MVAATQRKRRRHWRGWLLGGLLVAGGIRLAACEGLLWPLRIAGGSMASTLLGPHLSLVCRDCEFPFRFDADPRPEGALVACPNCALLQEYKASAEWHPGQRVVIDRGAFWFRSPRRNELVAFRDPLDPTRRSVKRIAGLPGERLKIAHGDRWSNGVRAVRTAQERRRAAVMVHDDRFRPHRAGATQPRWAGQQIPSGWRQTRDGYAFTPLPDRVSETNLSDWLVYHHQASYVGPAAGRAAPVRDHLPYNQGTSRQLNVVRDLGVSCEVQIPDPQTHVGFFADTGPDRYEIWLRDNGRQVTLSHNHRLLHSCKTPLEFQDHPVRIEYSICDGRVYLEYNGEPVLEFACEGDSGGQPPNTPLGIAARGAVRVSGLRVYRDTVWLPPSGRTQDRWARGPLKRGEWLVLGDNPAISLDSRNWPQAAIEHHQLLGKVILLGSPK